MPSPFETLGHMLAMDDMQEHIDVQRNRLQEELAKIYKENNVLKTKIEELETKFARWRKMK